MFIRGFSFGIVVGFSTTTIPGKPRVDNLS
jgi:hypothetical protein